MSLLSEDVYGDIKLLLRCETMPTNNRDLLPEQHRFVEATARCIGDMTKDSPLFDSRARAMEIFEAEVAPFIRTTEMNMSVPFTIKLEYFWMSMESWQAPSPQMRLYKEPFLKSNLEKLER